MIRSTITVNDLDLELSFEADSYIDEIILQEGDFTAVVYASPDYSGDCPHPLDDCDGQGAIHHHPRSRYGSRDTDYYEILGLDSYGDPIVDTDALQVEWEKRVQALPDSVFIIPEGYESLDVTPDELRNALSDEEVEDVNLFVHCKYAWNHHNDFDLPSEVIETLADRVADELNWDYQVEAEKCYEQGDPDAMLLDCYEHGLVKWSLASSDGCRWDTSRGAAVWVPDQYAREELDYREQIFNFAWIEETSFTRGRNMKYVLHTPQGSERSDDWLKLDEKAKQIATLYLTEGAEPRFSGRSLARAEMVYSILETYTDWCNGVCYGVCVDFFHGHDLVDEDACWGYIGSDSAEDEVANQANWAKHHLTKLYNEYKASTRFQDAMNCGL